MAFSDLVTEMAATVVDADVGVAVAAVIKRRQTQGVDFKTMAETVVVSSTQAVLAVKGRARVTLDDAGKARTLTRTYTVKASALAWTPDADDLVVEGGFDHTIVRVEPIASDAMLQVEVERPL